MCKSKSQSIVRIVLQEQEGREHKVTMFGEVIQSVCDISKGMPGNEEVCKLSDLLLMSPLFTYTLNTQKLYDLQRMQVNDGICTSYSFITVIMIDLK